MRKLLFIGLMTLSFISCKTTKVVEDTSSIKIDESEAFHFVKDAKLGEVVDLTAKEGKLVFIDIYTDWCLPCQVMNEKVFSDKPLGDYFNENFVSFKVNAEKGHGPDIATIYNVQKFPTLLFVDHNGTIIKQKDGLAFHTELREMAEQSILENSNVGTSE